MLDSHGKGMQASGITGVARGKGMPLEQESGAEPETSGALDEFLGAAFMVVKEKTGHDFSSYKTGTLARRIARRMALHELEGREAYLALLEQSPLEAQALYQESLIGVTSFFRDPEAFEVILRDLIPALVEGRDPEEPLRIWHACCSTGEEVYSLAILIREYLDSRGRSQQVQIFATDLDEAAVARARAGSYTQAGCAGLSEERLAAFFTRDGQGYQVDRSLREMIVFARHNIIKDPPFSRLDLLVCRNFLIYITTEMQRRLMPLFHRVLRPGGFLFLGSAETLGPHAELFIPVDKKWKIFRREEVCAESSPCSASFFATPAYQGSGAAPGLPKVPSLSSCVEKLLLERYSPPCVVVNEQYEVMHVTARTRFLEVPQGEPTRNLLRMVPDGLRPPLRAAIHKALTEKTQVVFRGQRWSDDPLEEALDVLVEPLNDGCRTGRLAMVVFEPAAPAVLPAARPAPQSRPDSATAKDLLIDQLEERLQIHHEQLLATVGQLENSNTGLLASNDELTSVNEEFQSANEKLRSTNEELETSKEELLSLNEELITVNRELQEKIEELKRAQNDMENFLVSAGIATVFLDRELRVMRYTPSMGQLFNLLPADLGRPFRHLYGRFDWPPIAADLQTALSGANNAEREVVDRENGRHYLLRLFPYLTSEGEIEGVVLKLVDITEAKRSEQRLLEYRKIIECSRDMVYVFDRSYRYLLANDAYLECRGTRHGDIIGRTLQEVIGADAFAALKGEIDACFAGREVNFESRKQYPEKGVRDVLVSFTPIGEGEEITRVACLIKDITERKQLEEELRQSQKMEAIGTLAGGIAHDFNNILTVISGYACLIQINSEGSEGSEAGSMASEIITSVERAAEMTRALLAFSRKQQVHLAPVDLNLVVTDLHKSLARLISEDIELVVQVSALPLIALADKGQLAQVLINLAVNARDAMPSGGTLLITTDEVELEGEEATLRGSGTSARYGMITVTDNGVGISKEIQKRVFEPFFTTKEVGKGTGLGLSTGYGIIEKHNGHIKMHSEIGVGTTFSIYLPLSSQQPQPDGAGATRYLTTGSETVLLVEDDEAVRTMTRLLLEQHGYRVLTAKDGDEALQIFAGEQGCIQLLITDVIMPRMNGRELSRQIHALAPGLPIIFMSGYPADVMSEKGFRDSVNYLSKPIKAELLFSKMREVLGEACLPAPG